MSFLALAIFEECQRSRIEGLIIFINYMILSAKNQAAKFDFHRHDIQLTFFFKHVTYHTTALHEACTKR